MTEPVTLADLKVHLRIEAGETGEDSYLEGLLIAARRAVELRTRRMIAGDVPTLTGADLDQAKHAIRLIVGSWYANREGATTEARSAPVELPLAVTWLLDPLVAWDNGEDEA